MVTVMCRTFTTAAAFKTHVYRDHRDAVAIDANDPGMRDDRSAFFQILCPVCGVVNNNLSELSSHYSVHFDQGVKVSCVISGCSCEFDVYSSYKSHMCRQHKLNKGCINPVFLRESNVDDETNVVYNMEEDA
jgi:hypothetical protein